MKQNDFLGALGHSEATSTEAPEKLVLEFKPEEGRDYSDLVKRILSNLTKNDIFHLIARSNDDAWWRPEKTEGVVLRTELTFSLNTNCSSLFVYVFDDVPYRRSRKKGYMFLNGEGIGINPIDNFSLDLI